MFVDKFEENVPLEQIQNEYADAIDIFPALHKYKIEHNTSNLQKLCVEISEFCRAVYASTQNAEEREIYKAFVEKLNK